MRSKEGRKFYKSYGDFYVQGGTEEMQSSAFYMSALAVLHCIFNLCLGIALSFPRRFRDAKPVSHLINCRKTRLLMQMIGLVCLAGLCWELRTRLEGIGFYGSYRLPFQYIALQRSVIPILMTLCFVIADFFRNQREEEELTRLMAGLMKIQEVILARAEQILKKK